MRSTMRSVAGVLLAILSFALVAHAEKPSPNGVVDGAAAPAAPAADHAVEGGQGAPSEEDVKKLMAAMQASLTWQNGDVVVGKDLATLKLGDAYRFLGPADAKQVLEGFWGNPPSDDVLGMVFPKDLGPLDDDNWGVVVTYTEEGHVEDDDAADIDYAEMMKEMQAESDADNQARREAGFPAVTVKGWAEPPRYDSESKKLYWAKELAFEGDPESTLNYDIRVLGRKGILVLQAVSAMKQLAVVRTGMQDVLKVTEFNAGSRYADFNPDMDEVAAYGIGALVAGKVASKVGLLAVVGAFLAKGWKIVLIAGAALIALLGKLRKKE